MGKAFNYMRGATVAERFWSKVDVKDQDECWEWLASLDTKGYGSFGMPKNDGSKGYSMKLAHRVSWELTHGKPLESSKQYLCHSCDNPKCVNPNHLFVGDAKINIQDCIKKGRFSDRNGEKNPRSKLTKEDVLNIRSSTLSLSKLAAMYGVVKSVVGYAKNGKTWRGL
jgi:hypothetical protein